MELFPNTGMNVLSFYYLIYLSAGPIKRKRLKSMQLADIGSIA